MRTKTIFQILRLGTFTLCLSAVIAPTLSAQSPLELAPPPQPERVDSAEPVPLEKLSREELIGEIRKLREKLAQLESLLSAVGEDAVQTQKRRPLGPGKLLFPPNIERAMYLDAFPRSSSTPAR